MTARQAALIFLLVAFICALSGLVLFLKHQTLDFVLGALFGMSFMTGLLYFISPRIRMRLEQ